MTTDAATRRLAPPTPSKWHAVTASVSLALGIGVGVLMANVGPLDSSTAGEETGNQALFPAEVSMGPGSVGIVPANSHATRLSPTGRNGIIDADPEVVYGDGAAAAHPESQVERRQSPTGRNGFVDSDPQVAYVP